ncbi:MAG: hypothetical protein FVQ78_10485 [Solirubrobacterales bacterium]|nr:hypothetical protein [Solirubrobacterales bacterium]
MANRPGEEASGGEKLGLAGVGVAAAVVVCCATLPLLVGVAGGIALAALLGVGAGILALAALVVFVVVTVRRRRACERPRQSPSIGPQSGREAPRARVEQPRGGNR